MAEEKPYIGSEQRPEITIDLDKNICALTLRELRRAILEGATSGAPKLQREIGDIKLVDGSPAKNGNKDKLDKESADLKSQCDLKVTTDKEAADSSSAPFGFGPTDRGIVELLRRLLARSEEEVREQK